MVERADLPAEKKRWAFVVYLAGDNNLSDEMVWSLQQMKASHEAAPVVAVLEDSRALVAKTRDGRAVVMLPVDWISWTETYDKALGEVERRARAELAAIPHALRMTGKASETAKREMRARGWTLVENLPTSFEIVQADTPMTPQRKTS